MLPVALEERLVCMSWSPVRDSELELAGLDGQSESDDPDAIMPSACPFATPSKRVAAGVSSKLGSRRSSGGMGMAQRRNKRVAMGAVLRSVTSMQHAANQARVAVASSSQQVLGQSDTPPVRAPSRDCASRARLCERGVGGCCRHRRSTRARRRPRRCPPRSSPSTTKSPH